MNSQIKNYKRFFIKTLGCKVNQYESEAMREILIKAGFKECLTKEVADIFVINTCTVTRQADKESRRFIAALHRTNPKAEIVVTGCYASNAPEELSFLPGVSNLLPNSEKWRIAEILEPGTKIYDAGHGDLLRISEFKDHTKAFVKIQDGCENFCSYCAVPLVRSILKSKPIMDVLEEINGLVAKGFKEIVLVGICLGAWGKDLPGGRHGGLIDLLKEFDRITGEFRIRLSSIEPNYITDELVDFISENRWVCRHLHIPLQSGDDDILGKMNRPYKAEDYLSIVEKAKAKIKGVAITTDAMIGFPGESEANFKNTLNLVKEIGPLKTHIFTFSKRRGTSACDMPGEVDKNVLRRRYFELNTAALGAAYLYRNKFLKTKLNVLVEAKRDRLTGLLKGYSDNYIKVLFEGADDLMREIVPVEIEYLNLMYTYGKHEEFK